MADATLPGDPPDLRAGYLALTRRRRIYSGITILIFLILFFGGFELTSQWNAGGFWSGLSSFFDFPASLVSEAWEERHQFLPHWVEPADGGAAEFEEGHFLRFLPALIETLNIAGTATLIGAIVGAFLSLLVTRGFAPFPRLIGVFRRVMDILRAIPEIVIALVLIFVLSGGPVPAMIAIALHTMGALGKLFSEVNENASLKPVEGLESVGANWSQRMALGVVPQVAPNWFSYALLRFEINIRASAILGFVGAGGIGYELRNAITFGQGRFDEAAAVFILLFLTIVVVDQISSGIRNRLTHGAAL